MELSVPAFRPFAGRAGRRSGPAPASRGPNRARRSVLPAEIEHIGGV